MRHAPYAFTEHGCVMLSNVLQSDRAVQVSVSIVRAFVRLREVLSAGANVARQLAEIRRQLQAHDQRFKDQDQKFEGLLTVLRAWMETPDESPPGNHRSASAFKRIRDQRRLATAAVSLADKLAAQKEVRALEAKRNRKRRELVEAQDDIDQQRSALIEAIEDRLQQSHDVETVFVVRWQVV